MISLKRHSLLKRHPLLASPADPSLRHGGGTSAPSEAEPVGPPKPRPKPLELPQLRESDDKSESGGNADEVEDTILTWFPLFLGGWGLMIIALWYL